jgi:hypothetical protein
MIQLVLAITCVLAFIGAALSVILMLHALDRSLAHHDHETLMPGEKCPDCDHAEPEAFSYG